MKRYFVFLLLCLASICTAHVSSHLNTDCVYVQPHVNYIDAAFLIELQEGKKTEKLKKEFESNNILLTEYNKFRELSDDQMYEFCSSIMSPYLLTQTLSHLSIYKYGIENSMQHILVVENHAKIADDLSNLERLINKLTEKHLAWDILYTDCGYHNAKTGELIEPSLGRVPFNKIRIDESLSKIKCRYGTVSYIISKSGMQKILAYFDRKWVDLPYDQVLFKIPGLNVYGANFDIITNEYSIEDNDSKVEADSGISLPFYSTGEEFWVDPIELLTHDRFDVIAKYVYARNYIKAYATDWHFQLYKAHLEKWIHFYNTEPLKIGFNDFLSSFNALIRSMYNQSFDEAYPIPINNFGLACDGAHRTGSSLALGVPVKVRVFESTHSPGMTADVFRNLYHLDEKYLDYMAYEYARLKENTLIVNLFPVGYEQRNEVEKILKKYGCVIHHKDIWFTQSGQLEFIRLIYNGEWWIGSHLDNFKHSKAKTKSCFPMDLESKYPVRVFLYECKNEALARKAKEEIRILCQCGNESVHINDNHEQTKIIAAGIFNANSISFLNNRTLLNCKKFDLLFKKLQKFIKENELDSETICVDTSAVLSAYGLRDCNDIDVVHKGVLPMNYQTYEIDDHNPHLAHHVKKLDEILFNPENHFYCNGIKFVSISLVEQMKRNRGSEKDISDVNLINRALKSDQK